MFDKRNIALKTNQIKGGGGLLKALSCPLKKNTKSKYQIIKESFTIIGVMGQTTSSFSFSSIIRLKHNLLSLYYNILTL